MIYLIILYLSIGLYETIRQYKNRIKTHQYFLKAHWTFELIALLIYTCIAPIIILVYGLRVLYIKIIYGK